MEEHQGRRRFKSIIPSTRKKWTPSLQQYGHNRLIGDGLGGGVTTTASSAFDLPIATTSIIDHHPPSSLSPSPQPNYFGQVTSEPSTTMTTTDNHSSTIHLPSLSITSGGNSTSRSTCTSDTSRRESTTSSSLSNSYASSSATGTTSISNHQDLHPTNQKDPHKNKKKRRHLKEKQQQQQPRTKPIKKSYVDERRTQDRQPSDGHFNRAFEHSESTENRFQQRGHAQPVDDPIQEFNVHSLSEANDSSQIDYVADKQRERVNSETHPKYPNFTLKLPYEAVIFDQICYNIPPQPSNFLKQLAGHICPPSANQPGAIPILRSVNLSVPQGSIFGLLGPSSCGKTTLLRCLVGLITPISGSIRLFGHDLIVSSSSSNKMITKTSSRQRNKQCQVPGKNVGYMPQDLGLYDDFTIREILAIFGRYQAMPSKLINDRIEFMTKFLELPDKDRVVGTLSGGQKRRVSFAIACFHMPPLIILDEPTVGVDPLLRRAIWSFLRQLATDEGRTIIITTHYIEEASRADQVALMRKGQIVMQDTPKNIMRSQSTNTLEEAFLKICNYQASAKLSVPPVVSYKYHNNLNITKGKCLPTLSVTTKSPLVPLSVDHLSLLPNPIGSNSNVKKLHHHQALVTGLEPASPHPLEFEFELDYTTTNEDNDPTGAFVLQRRDGKDVLSTPSHAKCKSATTRRINRLNPLAHGGKENFIKEKQMSQERRQLNQLIRHRLESESSSSFSRKPETAINDEGYGGAGGGGNCDLSVYNGELLKRRSKSWPRQPLYEYQSNRWNFKSIVANVREYLSLFGALIHKNYRRNFNTLPLVAFQFLLPIVQMITFCLCIGGKPINIGLGVVNMDNPGLYPSLDTITTTTTPLPSLINLTSPLTGSSSNGTGYDGGDEVIPLGSVFLSYVDTTMMDLIPYSGLEEAIHDVRRAKLWAAMELGPNFTHAVIQRFNLPDVFETDRETIEQSLIRLHSDKTRKILDILCLRSLMESYRQFLTQEFVGFEHLPVEMGQPVFSIKPSIISTSVDGYTESIAAGLMASLTYFMAAGLTTFIMVVERVAGILERTYTTGISPATYLMAHAVFRTCVMVAQIAFLMALTFLVLDQPLVGSAGLTYSLLLILNCTGISYGLLISSLCQDQNGAALTIVSSLVFKLTLSGILWPLEAIPVWLKPVSYVQPLTLPVKALRDITLKGAHFTDRNVWPGFLICFIWFVIFIAMASRRFKFYK